MKNCEKQGRIDPRYRFCLLLEVLLKETDYEHPISRKDLLVKLQSREPKVKFRGFENDIDIFNEFCKSHKLEFEIKIIRKVNEVSYYLNSHIFTVSESKILTDCIQAAKFITEDYSNVLINKICRLTNKAVEKNLKKQITISGRVKSPNEEVMASVVCICNAIASNHKVSYQYCQWTPEKKLEPKNRGKSYVVSPLLIVLHQENYYLVAWNEEYKEIRHYRIDKIKSIEELRSRRISNQETKKVRASAYTKTHFGMFGGDSEDVWLCTTREHVAFFIDYFGSDITLFSHTKETIKVRVRVNLSPQFYGWVDAFEGQVKILGPDRVLEKYRLHVQKLTQGLTEDNPSIQP